MTSLPIVERELRVAARRRWSYRERFIAALLAIFAASLVMLGDTDSSAKELGAELFAALSILVYAFVAIVGTHLTCDTLSAERREGTLGLLFLTNLRGYDVVLGKLAATSLHAAYSLLAIMPALAIPLLLGGVTNGEVWRVTLVSANLLFFFLCVGIFASAVCVSDQNALVLSIVIALVAVLHWPLLYNWMSLLHPGYQSDWIGLGSPIFGCYLADDDDYRSKNGFLGFWYNALITQGYAWTFLLLTCRVVRRSWQDRTTTAPTRGRWREGWLNWLTGSAAARAKVRARLLAINPFLWRAGHRRDRFITVWAFLALAAAGWGVCMELSGGSFVFDEPLDFYCVLAVHFILKLWVAGEASRSFAEDARSGALELLLTTPLPVSEIVRGQRQALFRQFAAPIAVVLAVDSIFLNGMLSHAYDSMEWETTIDLYIITGAFFVADTVAISWLAMRLGLGGRKPVKVILISFWWSVLLPGIISFGISAVMVMRSGDDPRVSLVALAWGIPSLIADTIIFSTAKFNMLDRLRQGAAERAGTRRAEPQVL